jgi:ATP-dependent protease ClpP protease subunit
MTDTRVIQLNKQPTRVWDLDVPVVIDETSKTITAYITNKIEDPYTYNELCYVLENATENYTVCLHVNTPGGVLDSAFMIVNAIAESKAHVVAKLSGTVASAGTIICLVCDEVIASEHLSFMIHNYSGSMSGKGHEVKARQRFTDVHLNAAFASFYSGFLTNEEIDNVIDGTDLWMGAEEVNERWKNRVSYLRSNNVNLT